MGYSVMRRQAENSGLNRLSPTSQIRCPIIQYVIGSGENSHSSTEWVVLVRIAWVHLKPASRPTLSVIHDPRFPRVRAF